MRCASRLLAAALLLTGSVTAVAGTVTDILGRRVELAAPAQRVILGEGRFLAAFGLLGITDPLPRLAGMLDDFRSFDPAGFERYRQAHPGIAQVPTFGRTSEASVSIEQAIALAPDAAIFGIDGHGPQAHSKVILDALDAAGIPVVFIDFRSRPLANTARSMEIIGEVLGRAEQGRAFARRYRAEVARVTKRLGDAAACPTVLIELRVGLGEECCLSVAEGLFADLLQAAGGCNIARGVLPGAVGIVNLEYAIAQAPEVYIGSAVGSRDGAMAGAGRIVLGAGVDRDTARASLAGALARPGLAQLPAVRSGRAHALWHHFYNSPLNVYALQQFARWLHPQRFADLDPDALLRELLGRYRPVDLAGTYAITLR